MILKKTTTGKTEILLENNISKLSLLDTYFLGITQTSRKNSALYFPLYWKKQQSKQ